MGLHNGQFIDLLGLSSICVYAISTKFKRAYLVLGYSAVNHLTQELFFLTSEFDSNTFPTPCQSFLYMQRSAKRPPFLLHVQFTSPCSGQIALCSNMQYKYDPLVYIDFRERSGRVLDSRPKGRGFEPHRRHCSVVHEQDTFILA